MAWSKEQLTNAGIIVSVGQSLGASARDITVALMAAMQESGLRNLNYGDRDSIGMFQQRNAWGSTAQRLDPHTSARMFFTGGQGGQRGLLDIGNRGSMSTAQAAQAVQVSAYPDAYAKWESQARQLAGTPGTGGSANVTTTTNVHMPGIQDLLKQPDTTQFTQPPPDPASVLGETSAASTGLGEQGTGVTDMTTQQQAPSPVGEVTFDSSGPGSMGASVQAADPMASLHIPTQAAISAGNAPASTGVLPQNTKGNSVTAFARKFIGVPYVWGGESPTGFDCSGFVQYVYKHMGVNLPRISSDQARAGKRIDFGDLQPGDLVAVDNSSRNAGADHIGIYLGNGLVINAPHPGASVQIDHLSAFGGGWGVRLKV